MRCAICTVVLTLMIAPWAGEVRAEGQTAVSVSAKIGDFDSELVEDFWQALAANSLCNLHILVHYGRNSHHMSEAIFKASARALRMAVEGDPHMSGVPSTKGTLAG